MGKASAQKNLPAAPPSPRATAGGVSAASLARELGVALEVILEIGQGKTYFTAVERAVVQATVEQRMLAGKIPLPAAAPVDPEATPAATEDLTLTRVFPWSKNLLANRANGLEVVVQVASSRFLQAGMVLEACTKSEMGWAYYGRLPRVIGEAQLFFPKRKPPTNDEK